MTDITHDKTCPRKTTPTGSRDEVVVSHCWRYRDARRLRAANIGYTVTGGGRCREVVVKPVQVRQLLLEARHAQGGAGLCGGPVGRGGAGQCASVAEPRLSSLAATRHGGELLDVTLGRVQGEWAEVLHRGLDKVEDAFLLQLAAIPSGERDLERGELSAGQRRDDKAGCLHIARRDWGQCGCLGTTAADDVVDNLRQKVGDHRLGGPRDERFCDRQGPAKERNEGTKRSLLAVSKWASWAEKALSNAPGVVRPSTGGGRPMRALRGCSTSPSYGGCPVMALSNRWDTTGRTQSAEGPAGWKGHPRWAHRTCSCETYEKGPSHDRVIPIVVLEQRDDGLQRRLSQDRVLGNTRSDGVSIGVPEGLDGALLFSDSIEQFTSRSPHNRSDGAKQRAGNRNHLRADVGLNTSRKPSSTTSQCVPMAMSSVIPGQDGTPVERDLVRNHVARAQKQMELGLRRKWLRCRGRPERNEMRKCALMSACNTAPFQFIKWITWGTCFNAHG
ncbi:hypothetical protein B0H19DRAFT_1081987 [Mycena capillaripes]|nr:hypothetical protein B0H19DRAFT_1081987 [Mycena capillaripes]